jgi:hypothetical protein
MTYSLNIDTAKNGTLTVKWSDLDALALYANLQSGFYLQSEQSFSKELLLDNFKNWNQMFWSQRENQGMFNYPEGAKILDIGAGMSVVDLLLYNYIPNSEFYLLDVENLDQDFATLGPRTICYSETYPYYNSWAPVKDAIMTSNFDQNRFNFLNAIDQIPQELDVITSYLSWCCHYPKDIYWDKVFTSLKTGGKLILDVRPLHNRDVIEEISDAMKSHPVKFTFPKVPNYVDTFNGPEKDVVGYRCMWSKKS